MTHDTDHPKETVEEREHSVFVPPNEQHVREDGVPTEPAEPAERVHTDQNDPDRVDATGTEAVPQPPETSGDTDKAVEPIPATPLDTGTAEDAERAEDTGAEDETRAVSDDDDSVDGRRVGEHMDARNVDSRDVDSRDVDSREMDAVDGEVYAGTVGGRDDAIDVDSVDVDSVDVDSDRVDPGDVAVGTAAVPEQANASTAEFWPAGVIDDLRGRWDAVQIRFVDDPSGVAADAKALVGEAVATLRQAIDRLEAKLDEAASDARAEVSDETERLRQQVAHYRNVFESLLRG